MAKRKKKSKVSGILMLVIAVLGLAATCMMFLPAINTGTSDNPVLYTGLEVAFGKSGLDLGTIVKSYLPFNILAALAYILPVAAGVLVFLSGKKGTLLKGIATLLFVGAAVLLFVQPTYLYLMTESSLIGSSSKSTLDCVLSYGSIIGGCLSGVAGISTAYLLIK